MVSDHSPTILCGVQTFQERIPIIVRFLTPLILPRNDLEEVTLLLPRCKFVIGNNFRIVGHHKDVSTLIQLPQHRDRLFHVIVQRQIHRAELCTAFLASVDIVAPTYMERCTATGCQGFLPTLIPGVHGVDTRLMQPRDAATTLAVEPGHEAAQGTSDQWFLRPSTAERIFGDLHFVVATGTIGTRFTNQRSEVHCARHPSKPVITPSV